MQNPNSEDCEKIAMSIDTFSSLGEYDNLFLSSILLIFTYYIMFIVLKVIIFFIAVLKYLI